MPDPDEAAVKKITKIRALPPSMGEAGQKHKVLGNYISLLEGKAEQEARVFGTKLQC